MFVTYLTIYSGDLLPPFYIGSTSLERFKSGYHGTVLSKKYKSIYRKELKENPHLFDTCIIAEFDTRIEATECELHYQKLHDAVKSNKFFNMSLAQPKGFFGASMSGESHPLYGSNNAAGYIHSYNPKTGETVFLPYIPEGNIKGRGQYKASSHNKGKRWYNNGLSEFLYIPGEQSSGWNIGALTGDIKSKRAKTGHMNMSAETKALRAKAVSDAKRGPLYEFYDELYALWVFNDRISPKRFKDIAVKAGYPNLSYHSIIYGKFRAQYENS